jgi:hypothetical protein
VHILGLIVNNLFTSVVVHESLEVAHQLRAVSNEALRSVYEVFVGAQILRVKVHELQEFAVLTFIADVLANAVKEGEFISGCSK